jgi:hypothetical protein
MKQARAFGLGVVLATQNPVDLDYKGLSNAGTWFLGRLQTERDKARVLDGLEGAAATAGAGFDRQKMEATLAALGSRIFLMNNVHDDEPVVFQSRWALSYLRGPLTRQHIQQLMQGRKESAGATPAAPSPAAAAPIKASTAAGSRPVVPPGITERFMEPSGELASGSLVYRPGLFAVARAHYANTKFGVDVWREYSLLHVAHDDVPADPWDDALRLAQNPAQDFAQAPVEEARFSQLPAELCRPKSYASWKTGLKNYVYGSAPLTLFQCVLLKATSRADESEGDFRARLALAAREQRDLQIEKLRKRYVPKLASIEERIRKAEERVDRERSQLKDQTFQSAISFGSSIVGALFGRKLASRLNIGRAASSMRSAGRVQRERGDVSRAEDNVEALQEKRAELEAGLQEQIQQIEEGAQPGALEIESIDVQPRKSDIEVGEVMLLWTPWSVDSAGIAKPQFDLPNAAE